MVKTINLQLNVPTDRKIHFMLPPDIPTGLLEAVLIIVPPANLPANDSPAPTLDNLLHAEFFGMWQGRSDIEDSSAFAKQLRTKAWSRPL